MPSPVTFPTTKPLPPAPEIGDLNAEERDAWNWIMTAAGFDSMIVDLTPRLARLLLTRVGDNRKPKRATILRYAATMRAGQWQLTHQGIAVSTRFEVIDGQHRLFAVVESGARIEVLAVRGVSQDAILVFDNGTARTDADSIRIHDIGLKDLETIEVTTAKRMIRSCRKFMRPVSRADLRTFILKHRTMIQLAHGALWQEGRVPNVTHAEVNAVLARAAYACPRDVLISVGTFLANGKAPSEEFESLRLLREWLLKATPKELRQRYGKTERALRGFLDKAKVDKRLTEAREELFPIPGEEDV